MDLLFALAIAVTIALWVLNIADVLAGRDDDDHWDGGDPELALELVWIPIPINE